VEYNELIFSKDFEQYRREQMLEIVEHISTVLKTGADAKELKGILDISTKLIRLPAKLVNNKQYAEQLDRVIQTDLVNISTYLVREYLKD